MPNRIIDRIIRRSLVTAETISQEIRERLVRRVTAAIRSAESPDIAAVVREARLVLEQFEPVLARALSDADIASWLFGASRVGNRIPKSNISELPDLEIELPRVPPLNTPQVKPLIEFPFLNESIKALQDRKIVTRDTFDQLEDIAKLETFTVAELATEDAIERVQIELLRSIQEGTTLDDFSRALSKNLETSHLGSGHIETIFRTNIQAKAAEGQEVMANNRVFGQVLPYARYDAIRDGRVRDEHLALEKLGLNGTNVYRSDDPIWRHHTPPWGFRCRCTKTFLTIRQAAALGVREAQEWLDSGDPPTDPEFVTLPFGPDPDFVSPGLRYAGV